MVIQSRLLANLKFFKLIYRGRGRGLLGLTLGQHKIYNNNLMIQSNFKISNYTSMTNVAIKSLLAS